MKYAVLIIVLSALVHALSFEDLLQQSKLESPYLKSYMLDKQKSQSEAEKLSRYANPSLGLSLSRFDPDSGNAESGFGLSMSQKIRLWGVSSDIDNLARSMVDSAEIDEQLALSRFVRDLSRLYVDYKESVLQQNLKREEVDIAREILNISQARYLSGTEPKMSMLRAKIALKSVENSLTEQGLLVEQYRFKLLQFAGIEQYIDIDTEHRFVVVDGKKIANLELKKLKSMQSRALFRSNLNKNIVDSVELGVEFERESDQDIYRAILVAPLAIFNRKNEEVKIEALKAERFSLLEKNRMITLELQHQYLKQERKKLLELKRDRDSMLKDERDLLKMYEESYRVASSNLLELQEVKNTLIESRKKLIFTEVSLDRNAIDTNYINGEYNE